MTIRPAGAVFLAILLLGWGLMVLIGGLVVLILGPRHSGSLATVMGIIFIASGLVYIALGIGCFLPRSWVWTVGVPVSIVSTMIGFISIPSSGAGAILHVIVSLIILYYLFRPNVKAWFGKA